jgi:branched-chain amino acid transport system substrate-binding protein
VHWTYDTYAVANGTAKAVTKQGGKTWFFLTADYAFGHSLEKDAIGRGQGQRRQGAGLGASPVPGHQRLLVLPAQGPELQGAQIIGLANAGSDTINSIKQAAEFGITPKQSLAGLLMFITDMHSLGLKTDAGHVPHRPRSTGT